MASVDGLEKNHGQTTPTVKRLNTTSKNAHTHTHIFKFQKSGIFWHRPNPIIWGHSHQKQLPNISEFLLLSLFLYSHFPVCMILYRTKRIYSSTLKFYDTFKMNMCSNWLASSDSQHHRKTKHSGSNMKKSAQMKMAIKSIDSIEFFFPRWHCRRRRCCCHSWCTQHFCLHRFNRIM